MATRAVVPEPRNGSRTMELGGDPSRMQGVTRFGGKVAKWA